MKINTRNLKEIYGKNIKTIANDERFYQVPDASDFIFSTYCRLFELNELNQYQLVPLKYESPWRYYRIKFDNEDVPRMMSINRLAGLVFFPDIPNAFLEPFHDDWNWKSWNIENLHLFKGSKEQRRKQRVERILALCERREPKYDDELKSHSFFRRFSLPKGIKLSFKLSRDYRNMKSRSLNRGTKSRNPRYKNTRICDDWRENPDAFKQWWIDNRYDYPGEELQLDKDILSFGQADIYAPECCCFVPRRINDIFTASNSKLKYSITKRKNKDGAIIYVIPPNAFGYGETFSSPNYFEALNEGRRRKAEMIRRIVEEERYIEYMKPHILDAMERWANLIEMGKIEMLEPSEEDLKMEGIV